uniref:Uncharacterized protein n=1 Tax=Rhodnius prolixus TaxID=13249 RepID=T1I1J3_RHOPR
MAQIITKKLNPNLFNSLRLLAKNEIQSDVLSAALTKKKAKYDLLTMTKRFASGCGGCSNREPPKKDKCKSKKKSCSPQCPLDRDLTKATCPQPTRPPQPESCKQKFQYKKQNKCPTPCSSAQSSSNKGEKPC